MPEQMAGLPYWQCEYDERGTPTAQTDGAGLADELRAQGITDLLFFSHGWNNSRSVARGLYGLFFAQLAPLLNGTVAGVQTRPGARVGVAGVIWPAMRWADEPPPSAAGPGAGGAAGVGQPAQALDDAALVRQLAAVYTEPQQQAAIEELANLLQRRPSSDAALQRFQELMRPLTQASTASTASTASAAGSGAPATGAPEDQGERALVERDHREVFDRFSQAVPAPHEGGAAGLGDVFSSLWDGAKQALRQATYWQMKQRAGVVGQQGLAPLIRDLHERQPDLRIHLIGHSFGARLVSFALLGLPGTYTGPSSPVKSVTLLQGAFSHFAFAGSLPQDPSRSGALHGMANRVDGPLLISFSDFDTAVGRLYPLASIAAGQDASNTNDPLFPWGAMGHDGAQAVGATVLPLSSPPAPYTFSPGRFYNLDGNQVIVAGGPPSGAHGDICHPETAWAVFCAAGLTAQ